MATSSIFHNIIIEDRKSAEKFVEALEQAAFLAEHSPEKTSDFNVHELTTPEEILTFFDAHPILQKDS